MQYLHKIVSMKYRLYLINTEANIIIFIIMMRKKRHSSNDIPQSYVCSIIPTHSIATPTDIHHFNICSLAFHHVDSTVGFGWCFGENVYFGLSLCNNSFFYGQTLIMNSVQE